MVPGVNPPNPGHQSQNDESLIFYFDFFKIKLVKVGTSLKGWFFRMLNDYLCGQYLAVSLLEDMENMHWDLSPPVSNTILDIRHPGLFRSLQLFLLLHKPDFLSCLNSHNYKQPSSPCMGVNRKKC